MYEANESVFIGAIELPLRTDFQEQSINECHENRYATGWVQGYPVCPDESVHGEPHVRERRYKRELTFFGMYEARRCLGGEMFSRSTFLL